MNAPATSDLEQWLRTNGQTIDTALDAPRAVTERLRFVAGLLAELEKPPAGPALVFRPPAQRAIAEPIDGVLTVGRQSPANLVFDDRRLSRSHFAIRRSSDGHVLVDKDSRNGTYVNGSRVKTSHLRDGNIIEAGAQVFVFLDQLAAV
jgi:hypothetical protein